MVLSWPNGDPVVDGGRLTVFFNGRCVEVDGSLRTRVGMATCGAEMLDDWTISDAFVLEDGAYCAGGSVLKFAENEFRLYYSHGTDKGFRVACSSDGKRWLPGDEVLLSPGQFQCNRIGLPFVTRQDGGDWLMLFEGLRQDGFAIYAATSQDSINWIPAFDGRRLIQSPEGRWDDNSQANPSLGNLIVDGAPTKVLFYNGYSRRTVGFWELAATKWQLNLEPASEPFLTRADMPDDTHRLEGARLVRSGHLRDPMILFFRLPTKDSYAQGEIRTAVLTFEDQKTQYQRAEQAYNDTLALKYFDIWENYPIQRFTNEIETAWLKQLVRPGQTVLLAGSGGGRELPAILERASRIVALDISQKMLDEGRRHYSGANVEWRLGDLLEPPAYIGKFDHVIALGGVFAYLPDLERAFTVMHTLLNSDGMLTIAVMNAEHSTEESARRTLADGRVRQALTRTELEQAFLAAGFELPTVQAYRFFVDILPAAWNRREVADPEGLEILMEALAVERRLIDKVSADKGKFLWASGRKP